MLSFGVSISAICWLVSGEAGALRRLPNAFGTARRPYRFAA